MNQQVKTSFFQMSDEDSLNWESEIIWKIPPKNMPYVRHRLKLCSNGNKLIRYSKFKLAGYATLRRGVTCEYGLLRRVFYLKPEDRYFDPEGTYKYGVPPEAIDPLTVSTGILGTVTDRALGWQLLTNDQLLIIEVSTAIAISQLLIISLAVNLPYLLHNQVLILLHFQDTMVKVYRIGIMAKYLIEIKDPSNGDAGLLQLDANSVDEATREAKATYPSHEIIRVRGGHGGKRIGSGRVGKWGDKVKTQVYRLPPTLGDNAEEIVGELEMVRHILDSWESRVDESRGKSAGGQPGERYKHVAQLLADLKQAMQVTGRELVE